MTILKLTTAAGTNASLLGDAYAGFDGVSWRNSVDNCDSDGNGRVFLECESDEVAEFVAEHLEDDDRIVAYGNI